MGEAYDAGQLREMLARPKAGEHFRRWAGVRRRAILYARHFVRFLVGGATDRCTKRPERQAAALGDVDSCLGAVSSR